MLSGYGKYVGVLSILAIPIFLITTSVTWAITDLRLYSYGFDKYEVAEAGGIARDDLISAARDIRAYFNSTNEPLNVKAKVYGEERALFDDREISHMRDVKRLVWGVYIAGATSGTYLLATTLVGFLRNGRRFATVFSRCILYGGMLTVSLVLTVGLIAMLAFDQLFQLFHQVSFSNDFWQLDPNRHYLVIMFPNGFWFDATIFVALASICMALASSLLAGGYLVATEWRERKETSGKFSQSG